MMSIVEENDDDWSEEAKRSFNWEAVESLDQQVRIPDGPNIKLPIDRNQSN